MLRSITTPTRIRAVGRSTWQTRSEGGGDDPMTTSNVIGGGVLDKIRPGTEVAGGFFRMCVLTGKALMLPFEWREFIWVGWFLMRVSLLPTIAVSIPETVLLIFTLNLLLAEIGAADVSGAGAAIGAVTQLG